LNPFKPAVDRPEWPGDAYGGGGRALFAALVKRLEVHDVDDVRPTFLLGGPTLPDGTLPGEGTGSGAEVASNDSVFACHSPGWTNTNTRRA
jgi:hypothetical protein